jgi:hypothetical protein
MKEETDREVLLALSFNFTISYIDDVLSLNHSKFGYFVLSDSYLNVHLYHRYADSLLTNASTKHNKYVVNQTLEHIDDINFTIRAFQNS